MKHLFTSFLLGFAIALIAIGIHKSNPIIIGIGGFLAGIYDTIINNQD